MPDGPHTKPERSEAQSPCYPLVVTQVERGRLGRLGVLAVLGFAALEVLIMISPFAGFFYARMRFEPLLGFLSQNRATAWLDGFFLNHSLVSRSPFLELQREIGLWLFILGFLGFVLSAKRVYGKKMSGSGVAVDGLYGWVRHPQYLCLGVAGWGLLTTWPRFLLLVVWITMLFLYSALARSEERRMAARFGESYSEFARSRGSFLPGSPVHRLFEASFGKFRPRALGWAGGYVVSLALAIWLGFGLRAYTRASAPLATLEDDQIALLSVWPQPREWMERIDTLARADSRVRRILGSDAGSPLVATILPPSYPMRGMYFAAGSPSPEVRTAGLARATTMGQNPADSSRPVEIVYSRPLKDYAEGISFGGVLDVDVRLIPLAVVTIDHRAGAVLRVDEPEPRNEWGAHVVMPIF